MPSTPFQDLSRPPIQHLCGLWVAIALISCAIASGCASSVPPGDSEGITLPLLRGWFEGHEVLYVTTDVSSAGVAQAKGANFSPRLAYALPAGIGAAPGRRTSVDKVYSVTNLEQGSVFASAPTPIGHQNRDVAYSPLWQLVKVTWASGAARRVVKSEEEVLAAAEKAEVQLDVTDVVLNCPIVSHGYIGGALPGVSVVRPSR